jgi:Arc/MetJ family transcription regulator
MVTHMKTTVEISDALLAEARAVASREGTTVRALLEEGLRVSLERRKHATRFKLRKATFRGTGLRPGFSSERWDQIRDAAYEGRGA